MHIMIEMYHKLHIFRQYVSRYEIYLQLQIPVDGEISNLDNLYNFCFVSACTSASLEPSYVLRAVGADEDLAHSSIR